LKTRSNTPNKTRKTRCLGIAKARQHNVLTLYGRVQTFFDWIFHQVLFAARAHLKSFKRMIIYFLKSIEYLKY